MKTSTKCAGALVALWLAAGFASAAAESTPIEVRLSRGGSVTKAPIEALSWLEGRWVSDDGRGMEQRIFLAPKGGQMPGIVSGQDGETSERFELTTIAEFGDTLAYRFGTVYPDLNGRAGVEFELRYLVAIEGDAAYFQGATFVRRGADRMSMAYVFWVENITIKREIHYRKVPFGTQ